MNESSSKNEKVLSSLPVSSTSSLNKTKAPFLLVKIRKNNLQLFNNLQIKNRTSSKNNRHKKIFFGSLNEFKLLYKPFERYRRI